MVEMNQNIINGLLPCPWCHKVPCLHRSCYGGYFLLHSCDVIKINMGKGRKKELIEKWNNGIISIQKNKGAH